MRAVICAGGQVTDYGSLRPWVDGADLVVCADSGFRHAVALGLRVDLLVGDMDSIGARGVAAARQGGVPMREVARDKDQTDTHLAIEAALALGARELVLVGATGGRLDHTLANLLLLPGLPPGVRATLVDAQNVVRLLQGPAEIELQGDAGAFVSLLPLSPAVEGIRTDGLKWELQDGRLAWGSSLGVSNQFAGTAARIWVQSGALLVIQARD